MSGTGLTRLLRATAATALCGAVAGAGLVRADDTAARPLWANLAECSAVFDATAGSNGYAADPQRVALMREGARAFHDAAVRAAHKAGQADATADVASVMAYLVPRWQNRVEDIGSLRSNLDWISYCARLGRTEGILPLPD